MGDIETIIGPVTFANRDGLVFHLDLENAYIDASTIEDLRQLDKVTQATQDDSQDPVLVPCRCCKYNHTKCDNQEGLFYQIPCNIVKKCEQGEAC